MNKNIQNQPSSYGITRNVYMMGIVSLANDIGSEMIYPLLPIFLTTVLGTPIAIVGLIEGFAEAVASILKVASGWLSDSIGRRKPFVLLGYSLSTCAKFLFVLAHQWPLVFVARSCDRFGKGMRTSARDALISESTPVNAQGKAFGLHRALDTVGAVFGPLIALFLWHYTAHNFRLIFMIAAIPCMVGVILLALAVREIRSPKKIRNFSWPPLSAQFATFLMINALFALGNSSEAFILLHARYLGLSVATTIAVYVLMNTAQALTSFPAGIMSDRLGAKKVMALGFFIFALVYGAFGFFQSAATLWPICIGYGFYLALTDGVGKAYIAQIIPAEYLGSAYGLYQIITGLCNFIASLAAGLLWQLHPNAPFLWGSVLALLASGLLFYKQAKN